jgi:hypothetical protein
MLFEFSKRLLVLSVLAGVLYYIMTYPMVFEKVRKYLPFKFNNTKSMLIFNSVVFSLVMYFAGFILLKSLHLEGFKQTPTPTPGSYPRITGLWVGNQGSVYIYVYKSGIDYSGKIIETLNPSNWKTVDIYCNEESGSCSNKSNFSVRAKFDNGIENTGTIASNKIEWSDGTIWNKYIGDTWVESGKNTWGFITGEGGISCSQSSYNPIFETEGKCSGFLSIV